MAADTNSHGLRTRTARFEIELTGCKTWFSNKRDENYIQLRTYEWVVATRGARSAPGR